MNIVIIKYIEYMLQSMLEAKNFLGTNTGHYELLLGAADGA